MANTKSSTTGRTGSSGATTSKKTPSAASTLKAASTAPDESDFDEFDEFDAVRQLQAKAEAAAQEAEAAAQDAEAAAEEAEAAAEAAMAARAALSRRNQPAQSDGDAPSRRRPRPRQQAPQSGMPSDNESYLGMMSGLLGDMSGNNWDDDKFDEMSQSVAMVMGTGPAFATLGTMLANSTAQSSVLMNATQMQRQLDMVGLSCTSACVQQLLNMNNGSRDSD